MLSWQLSYIPFIIIDLHTALKTSVDPDQLRWTRSTLFWNVAQKYMGLIQITLNNQIPKLQYM